MRILDEVKRIYVEGIQRHLRSDAELKKAYIEAEQKAKMIEERRVFEGGMGAAAGAWNYTSTSTPSTPSFSGTTSSGSSVLIGSTYTSTTATPGGHSPYVRGRYVDPQVLAAVAETVAVDLGANRFISRLLPGCAVSAAALQHRMAVVQRAGGGMPGESDLRHVVARLLIEAAIRNGQPMPTLAQIYVYRIAAKLNEAENLVRAPKKQKASWLANFPLPPGEEHDQTKTPAPGGDLGPAWGFPAIPSDFIAGSTGHAPA